MDQTPETQETPQVVDTDAARHRVRNFLNRHQPKLRTIALVGGGVAAFAAGRKSKDYVESVDVDVTTPDSSSDQS